MSEAAKIQGLRMGCSLQSHGSEFQTHIMHYTIVYVVSLVAELHFCLYGSSVLAAHQREYEIISDFVKWCKAKQVMEILTSIFF